MRPSAVLAALVLALYACSGADDGGGDGTDGGSGSGAGSGAGSGSSGGTGVDFDTDIQPLLNTNCLCHMQDGAGMMEADYLTMNPGMAEANLLGVSAMGAPDIVRVAPGDRAGSYLWHKINGTHGDVGGTGDAMPPLGPLAADQIELIGAWIDGA